LKKQLFDLEVKGQGPTKVITVRDTPHYGHAPTYQISLTYLERQKSYAVLVIGLYELLGNPTTLSHPGPDKILDIMLGLFMLIFTLYRNVCKILYLLHFNRENLVFLEAPLGKMVKVNW
jgi:hypothetical protein